MIGIVALVLLGWWGSRSGYLIATSRLVTLTLFIGVGYLVMRLARTGSLHASSSSAVPPPLPSHARGMNRGRKGYSEIEASFFRGVTHNFLRSILVSMALMVAILMAVLWVVSLPKRVENDLNIPHRMESLAKVRPRDFPVRASKTDPMPPPAIPESDVAQTQPEQGSTEKSETTARKREIQAPAMPKPRKTSDTGVDLVELTTDPFPTEFEAQQGALAMSARFLASALSHKGLLETDWQPSLSWTKRNFVENLYVEKVPRAELVVFIGHAEVRSSRRKENRADLE